MSNELIEYTTGKSSISYSQILLCEDGSVINSEGKLLGTIKDNLLWENPQLAPKLMKLCKKHSMYYPRCFMHKATRTSIKEEFKLHSLRVEQELPPTYWVSEDKLIIEFRGPLGIIPPGLIEALDR